ncbi:MAG: GntR family transcriptional regulator [Oscillospiraceae bacterium]|nr:GntR family transcriptional regulator [Oscillospiraceae bacterium]
MIQLDYRDARPIYRQVKDGLRHLIVTGVLAGGEQLPSVRQLATQLAINPNTIVRAYAELEAEGFVYSVGGKGTFVAENADTSGAARRQELEEQVLPILQELRELGMRKEELDALWEGGKRNA